MSEPVLPMNTVGKRTYSVAEIQSLLGISRRKAYELCNSGAFKVIHVGRVLRISKASFELPVESARYFIVGSERICRRINNHICSACAKQKGYKT